MRDRVKAARKVSGGFKFIDVGYGYFVVKFELAEDRWKVINGVPWMIFNRYLYVRTWTPKFIANLVKVDHTLVWVVFRGLNMVYYDESVLTTLASVVGHPVKVDPHTFTCQTWEVCKSVRRD